MPVAVEIPHRPSTRTVQWPLTDSEAIIQWRDMTADLPHRNQPQIEQHDGQQRSPDTPSPEASSSSSEDSSSPANKPRDPTNYLKYLVRGFLIQSRAMPTVRDPRLEKTPNHDSFVPSPRITFLIDEPKNLTCQICCLAPLKLAITAESSDPDMASILPCGHISCRSCMNIWLQNNNSCPFCRTNMIHKGCKHKVQPRLIAQDTIHTLPKTLANGGTIGDMCFKCTERHTRHESVKLMTELAERFKIARRQVEDIGTSEAIEAMHRAQDAFESLPEDHFSVLSNVKHHQW